MTTCANCGAVVEGRFCAKCGTAAGAPGRDPEPSSPSAAPMALDDNVASALCYLLLAITGLLFLVLEPYNRKSAIRFHAFQSIFATGAIAVCWVIVIVAGVILAYIPWVGPLLAALLFVAMAVGVFVLWIMLMYKAYGGKPAVLPWIGPLARKQS